MKRVVLAMLVGFVAACRCPAPAVRTPVAVAAPGGLIWKDATGARVPVTGEIYGLVFYRDDGGNFWNLDVSHATVSPVGEVARVFESADCSGGAFVFNPLPARVTFNYSGIPEARVIGTAATLISSTFRSTNQGEASVCSKTVQSGIAVSEAETISVPKPAPALVLPLHPELAP